MTLVLAALGRETIWLLADRRLSYAARRRPPIEDGIKLMSLETLSGVALLGYAGLGATGANTQPSDWMSAVLRGRSGLTVEQALGILTDVSNHELPSHLRTIGSHTILAPSFVESVGPRMFTINHVVDSASGNVSYQFLDMRIFDRPDAPLMTTATAGTGGIYLNRHKNEWLRELRTLIKANDFGRASDMAVATRLAELNKLAATNVRDGSVGARSIVVWRRSNHSRLPGGAHQYFDGLQPEPSSDDRKAFPIIANGIDMRALVGLMLTGSKGSIERGLNDPDFFQPMNDYVKDHLADVDWEPDERLL